MVLYGPAQWAGCRQSDFHERESLLDSEHERYTVSGVALSTAKNVRCTFYEVRPRNDKRGVAVLSDALPYSPPVCRRFAADRRYNRNS